MPEDIRKNELNEYEKGLLEELKHKIYTRRGGEPSNPLLDAMKGLKKDLKRKRK